MFTHPDPEQLIGQNERAAKIKLLSISFMFYKRSMMPFYFVQAG